MLIYLVLLVIMRQKTRNECETYLVLCKRWYGGPQLSRQNQKPHGKNKIPHGKTENLTAKTKTLQQNQKPHGKNKIPHGKTKNLTAKPNTSQQKQNSFGLAVGIYFCRGVFGFCCEVFGFVVRYFDFAARFFSFAVRFLVLPWQLWATVGWNKRCKYLYL